MALLQRIEHSGVEGVRCGRKNSINTSFIVYRINDTLIDTAPANQWRHLLPFFQEKPLRQILLTHHHEDHSGNAARLKQLTGLIPMASEGTGTIMAQGFSIPLIQKYIWGNSPPATLTPLPRRIELADGSELKAVPAPGHAEDMVCYFAPDKGWLFSADLYISKSIGLTH